MPIPAVPQLRVNAVNTAPIRPEGRFVLYWMIAQRRTRHNFGLQHAMARAEALQKPLIVLEALRVGYRWASPRMHRFVMDGMADNLARFGPTPIAYYPYLEPAAGHGSGLLEALAGESALVVTDEFPCFFLPQMVAAAGAKLRDLGVALEQVDGHGALPLRAAEKTYYAANHFRRHLQKTLPRHLVDAAFPVEDPLAFAGLLKPATLPPPITARWPSAAPLLEAPDALAPFLAGLPIDHAVPAVDYRGGEATALRTARAFIEQRLARYGEDRNEPELDVPSGLSPYLHFGHISVHEVLRLLFARDGWHPDKVATPNGSREGFWNLSPEGEGFIDELITWREIGYNFCFIRPDDYDTWSSLPDWARHTLEAHARDVRPHLYTRAELEDASTHDPLWNAAQQQLRREGRIHNYLRMLWGKKILEWSASPEEALDTLIELNNRWSTDGRNPNSYSGIFWTLGRFDRPWAPERPIFGTIRYMSSDNTAKKVRVKGYIARYTGRRLL